MLADTRGNAARSRASSTASARAIPFAPDSLKTGCALSSAKTAPASTAESWSLSPSITSRLDGATASSKCAASATSIMEASSTTITS